MTVNNIGNDFPGTRAGENSGNTSRRAGAAERIWTRVEERASLCAAEKRAEGTRGRVCSGGVEIEDRFCNPALAGVYKKCGETDEEAVKECAIRGITYADSDFSKVYVAEGYTVKAKIFLEERTVYLEQKFEDGTVKAYEVDMDKAKAGADGDASPGTAQILFWAGRAWDEGEKHREENSLDFYEELLKFYERVENQIKNGPPKIRIGGAEMSEEEWRKLIEKVDANLEAVREEQAKRLAEQLEEEEETARRREAQVAKLFEDRDAGTREEILTKADGSKVLAVTNTAGGTEFTSYIKIGDGADGLLL